MKWWGNIIFINNINPQELLFPLYYEVRKELGYGAFGAVYECQSVKNPCKRPVAVKIVENDNHSTIKKEITASKLLNKLKFNNIAEAAYFFSGTSRNMFVNEGMIKLANSVNTVSAGPCRITSVKERTKFCLKIDTSSFKHYAVFEMNLLSSIESIPYSSDKYYNLLLSIVKALNVAHSKRILHCDIKPDNIFVLNETFKLGDWGQSLDLNKKESFCLIPTRGAKAFQAPECNEPFLDWSQVPFEDAFKTDVYSLGASVLYMVLEDLEIPNKNIKQIVYDLHKDILMPPDKSSESLFDLLKGMTNPDPKKRFDCKQTLEHSYLK